MEHTRCNAEKAFYNHFLRQSNENQCKQKHEDIFVNICYILHRLDSPIGVGLILKIFLKLFFIVSMVYYTGWTIQHV